MINIKNYIMEQIFNEKTSREMETMVREESQEKLSRSKLFKLWVKFYAEWFGIEIELKDITVFYQDGMILNEAAEKKPGSIMVLVPKEITIQLIIKKILDLNLWTKNVRYENEANEITEDREYALTFVAYKEYYFTLLDELLLECFCYYQKGEFLPYGHRIVGNYFSRFATAHVDGKRNEITIWSNYSDEDKKGRRVKLAIYKKEENR